MAPVEWWKQPEVAGLIDASIQQPPRPVSIPSPIGAPAPTQSPPGGAAPSGPIGPSQAMGGANNAARSAMGGIGNKAIDSANKSIASTPNGYTGAGVDGVIQPQVRVPGASTPTSDRHEGEFILDAHTTQAIGPDTLYAMQQAAKSGSLNLNGIRSAIGQAPRPGFAIGGMDLVRLDVPPTNTYDGIRSTDANPGSSTLGTPQQTVVGPTIGAQAGTGVMQTTPPTPGSSSRPSGYSRGQSHEQAVEADRLRRAAQTPVVPTTTPSVVTPQVLPEQAPTYQTTPGYDRFNREQNQMLGRLKQYTDINSPLYNADRNALAAEIGGIGAASQAATRARAGQAGYSPEAATALGAVQSRDQLVTTSNAIGKLAETQRAAANTATTNYYNAVTALKDYELKLPAVQATLEQSINAIEDAKASQAGDAFVGSIEMMTNAGIPISSWRTAPEGADTRRNLTEYGAEVFNDPNFSIDDPRYASWADSQVTFTSVPAATATINNAKAAMGWDTMTTTEQKALEPLLTIMQYGAIAGETIYYDRATDELRMGEGANAVTVMSHVSEGGSPDQTPDQTPDETPQDGVLTEAERNNRTTGLGSITDTAVRDGILGNPTFANALRNDPAYTTLTPDQISKRWTTYSQFTSPESTLSLDSLTSLKNTDPDTYNFLKANGLFEGALGITPPALMLNPGDPGYEVWKDQYQTWYDAIGEKAPATSFAASASPLPAPSNGNRAEDNFMEFNADAPVGTGSNNQAFTLKSSWLDWANQNKGKAIDFNGRRLVVLGTGDPKVELYRNGAGEDAFGYIAFFDPVANQVIRADMIRHLPDGTIDLWRHKGSGEHQDSALGDTTPRGPTLVATFAPTA